MKTNQINITKTRESNIELLRLFSMLLIITSHFVGHGLSAQWHCNISNLNVINSFLAVAFGSYGKLGVALFIIIMGYYNYDKIFRLRKFLDIYLKTFIYSLVFFISLTCLGKHLNLMESIPMCKGSYWFIKDYLILYLISPILNKLIENIEKKKLKWIIAIFTAINFIPSTFDSHFSLGHIALFINLYLVGMSFKTKLFDIKDKYIYTAGLISIFIILVSYTLLIHKGDIILMEAGRYAGLYSIFTFFIACSIFKLFESNKFGSNVIINNLATSVFGVYLIHENGYIRSLLWNSIVDANIIMNSQKFLIISAIIIFALYFICIILDKFFMCIFGNLIKFLSTNIEMLFDRLKLKIKNTI